MKKWWVPFAGLVAYIASFFLIAVNGFAPYFGFMCAGLALWVPLLALEGRAGDMNTSVFPIWTLGYPALLASGLVNVMVPIAMILRCTGNTNAFFRLRFYILLMVASSWYVFLLLHFIPREGHVLWVLGIVTILFSTELTADLERKWPPQPKTAAAPRRPRFRLYQ